MPDGWLSIEEVEICHHCAEELRGWLARGLTDEDEESRRRRAAEPEPASLLSPTHARRTLAVPSHAFAEGETFTFVLTTPQAFKLRRIVVPSHRAGLGFSIEAVELRGERHAIAQPAELFSEVALAQRFDFDEALAKSPIFLTVKRQPSKVEFCAVLIGDVPA
jgi:hypothetical protein